MSKIKAKVAAPDRGQEELLWLLKEAQQRDGCLSDELIAKLAASLGLSIGEVYGVATFYSFFSIRPLGRNVIRICKSLPCFLKDCQVIVDSLKGELGIGPGGTTADGRFSFELGNCIGACDRAPAMMVNHDVYGDLTPGKIAQILGRYD